MKSSFPARPRRRTTLRDLYVYGVVQVFRRPSLFRIWEPLRQYSDRNGPVHR